IKLTIADKINNLPVPEIALNIEDDDRRPLSSFSQHSEVYFCSYAFHLIACVHLLH
ncbi:unnamed protein product, partial [Rotaria socialis]